MVGNPGHCGGPGAFPYFVDANGFLAACGFLAANIFLAANVFLDANGLLAANGFGCFTACAGCDLHHRLLLPGISNSKPDLFPAKEMHQAG